MRPWSRFYDLEEDELRASYGITGARQFRIVEKPEESTERTTSGFLEGESGRKGPRLLSPLHTNNREQ